MRNLFLPIELPMKMLLDLTKLQVVMNLLHKLNLWNPHWELKEGKEMGIENQMENWSYGFLNWWEKEEIEEKEKLEVEWDEEN